MKKVCTVSGASLVFLLFCSSVGYILRDIVTDGVFALIFGALLLILSGILALFAAERIPLLVICVFLNSVAMGVLIRAWYIIRELENSFFTMALVSLAAAVYLFLFFAILRIPVFKKSRKATVIYAVIYALISGVSYIALMLNTETSFISTFGYYMIIELGFIFAMLLSPGSRASLFRNLVLSTYSVVFVALGVLAGVIIALLCGEGGDCDCDCDCFGAECCDCLSGCDIEPGRKGSRKNKS